MVALFLKKLFDFRIVFNNPVVNDAKLSALAHMRMRVEFVRNAMGCPASVSDTAGPLQVRSVMGPVEQICNLSGCFCKLYAAFADRCDAGRIIASVFQLPQTVK